MTVTKYGCVDVLSKKYEMVDSRELRSVFLLVSLTFISSFHSLSPSIPTEQLLI